MIKGIERVAPMIHFRFRGVEVRLHVSNMLWRASMACLKPR
jgi:hypothetical protein